MIHTTTLHHSSEQTLKTVVDFVPFMLFTNGTKGSIPMLVQVSYFIHNPAIQVVPTLTHMSTTAIGTTIIHNHRSG
jgi:hypothetical protein